MSEARRSRATLDHTASEEQASEAMADAETPAPPDEDDTVPPTLRDAFYLLCDALAPLLEDDMPRWTHTQEIQKWMSDAGGDNNGLAQQATAWTHAIALLESVLGRPLMQR